MILNHWFILMMKNRHDCYFVNVVLKSKGFQPGFPISKNFDSSLAFYYELKLEIYWCPYWEMSSWFSRLDDCFAKRLRGNYALKAKAPVYISLKIHSYKLIAFKICNWKVDPWWDIIFFCCLKLCHNSFFSWSRFPLQIFKWMY